MRTFLVSILLGCILASGLTAQAAVRKDPVQQAGAKIVTPYFSVTIPEGWLMPHPVKKQPLDGISTVFATTSGNLALTINVMKAGMHARVFAEQTAENMKKSGLKVSPPRERRGFWVIDLKGPADGQAWFGSDGKYCAVITMFGQDFAQANAFLSKLVTDHPGLFPDNVGGDKAEGK